VQRGINCRLQLPLSSIKPSLQHFQFCHFLCSVGIHFSLFYAFHCWCILYSKDVFAQSWWLFMYSMQYFQTIPFVPLRHLVWTIFFLKLHTYVRTYLRTQARTQINKSHHNLEGSQWVLRIFPLLSLVSLDFSNPYGLLTQVPIRVNMDIPYEFYLGNDSSIWCHIFFISYICFAQLIIILTSKRRQIKWLKMQHL
jgi:hypothetical protein